MTPSLDTVKLCASKYYIEILHQNITLYCRRDSAQIGSELGKSDLNNVGNLVELLWHRV